MDKTIHLKTQIADFTAFSSAQFPAEITLRPAKDVLPDCALSTTAPKHRSSPVALSTFPVLMHEDEAGEAHLNAAITHRSWIHHGEKGAQKARQAPFAQRYHPDQPFYVLLVDANALATPTHSEVLKDAYQIIQPAAQALPDHDWREVVEWLVDHPRKCRAFAEVFFNQPSAMLSAKQIRTLLLDVVSEDSIQRKLKAYERAVQPDTPADLPPSPEPATELSDPAEPPGNHVVDYPTDEEVGRAPDTPAPALDQTRAGNHENFDDRDEPPPPDQHLDYDPFDDPGF